MHGEVSTRPERLPDDGDFLLSVYASTRRPELTGLGWTEKQQDAFIGMQFDAQTRQYRESFPDATYSVICADRERPDGSSSTTPATRSSSSTSPCFRSSAAPVSGAGWSGGCWSRPTPAICASDATSWKTAPPAGSGNMPGSPPRAATGHTWPWNGHPRPGHPDRLPHHAAKPAPSPNRPNKRRAANADDFTPKRRCINIRVGRWRVGP